MCPDDLLVPRSVPLIEHEISLAEKHQCALVAFRDQTIREVRLQAEQANSSPFLSGRRGLAILFLYGCVIGGLSNLCLRKNEHASNINFDSKMKYYGDINYYVDFLISGGSIYMSPVQTNIRQHHKSQISNLGNQDCDAFWETHAVIKKCISNLAESAKDKFLMHTFTHSVLHFQHYRFAAKQAFRLNFKPIKNIQASCGHATTFPTLAWVFVFFYGKANS